MRRSGQRSASGAARRPAAAMMAGSRFPLLLLTLSLNLIFRDLHFGARGFQLVKVKVGNRRAARKLSARSRAASKTPVPTSGEEPRRAPENNRAGIAVLQSISIPHHREPFATFTQRKKTSRENVSSLEGKEQEGKKQEGKEQEEQEGKKQEGKEQEGKEQEGKKKEGKEQEGKKQEGKKQEGKKQEGKKQEGKKQEEKNSTSKQEKQDEAHERLVQQELRKLREEEAQKTAERTQSETQDTPVAASEGEAAAGHDEAGARSCGRGCCIAWAVLGCSVLAVAIIGGLVYCSLSTTSGGDGVMGSAYSMNSNGGEPVSFGEDLGTASRKSFQVVNPEAQDAESRKNDFAGGFRQEAGAGGWNPLSSGGSKPASGGGGAAKRGRAADKNAPRGRGGTGRSTSVGSARKKKNFWGS